ncbi:MAG TPA: VWA domain-containing protein [Bacteroidota bacterium]|nr:VWA domain-containing protein [Bacteroidota bacterium]
MKFADPGYLYLLLIVPVMLGWYFRRGRKQFLNLRIPSVRSFPAGEGGWRVRFRHLPAALRVMVFSLLVVALARPQTTSEGENVTTEGIDIVLVTDVSGSMLAEDFRPNRIEAAKAVAEEFVDSRPDDRIGLVVFAGESFTQCPLTLDHEVLKTLIGGVKSGLIEDGTAIGMGLATAVSRLKDSRSKSRVIILLTDGVNNRGSIDPMTAAGIASTFGIRVYTVGVGTIGTAPYPVQTPLGTQYRNIPVEIDEGLLKNIADQTGGRYFRATDNNTLKSIYEEIDRLEKSKIEVTQFRRHKEDFYTAASAGGLLLLAEVLLSLTLFRKIP